jgi:hypothetical protein
LIYSQESRPDRLIVEKTDIQESHHRNQLFNSLNIIRFCFVAIEMTVHAHLKLELRKLLNAVGGALPGLLAYDSQNLADGCAGGPTLREMT